MQDIDRRGKYGKYLRAIIIAIDFLVVNICYIFACQFDDEVSGFRWKVTLLLVNISYLPASYWFSKVHMMRSIHIDHIALKAIMSVGSHALFFFSLLGFLDGWIHNLSFYLWFYALMTILLPSWWIISRVLIKNMRRHGRNYSRVVIVGTNETARRLHNELTSDASYGYKFLGFFDNTKATNLNEYIGGLDMLDQFVAQHAINEIYYTLSGEDYQELSHVIKIADQNVVQFFYVPQLSRYISRGIDLYTIGTVPILTIRHNPLKKAVNRYAKRLFDVVFSSIALILSPIVFIPVAIAIKVSSPGPVFFKQLRTGYRGRDFYCWKFRTMRINDESDSAQARRDDPRTTRVGEFLRHTSIDELPQFFNVLKGDMSVVGPRPHMIKHTQDYSRLIDRYMVRHVIKPGITGWAQVNGYRGQTEELWQMEKRVEADVWYIENWNFILDLKIIVLTVVNALRGEDNAF